MNGKNGLIADFVATFNSVRLSPQGHYVRARLTSTFCGSLFDILRFSSDLCHTRLRDATPEPYYPSLPETERACFLNDQRERPNAGV